MPEISPLPPQAQRTAPGPTTDAQVLNQAAQWYALLADESAPAHASEQWREWLNACDSHRRAWQKVEAIGNHFKVSGHLQNTERKHLAPILERVDQQRISRRRSLTAFSLVCIAGLGSWATVSHRAWPLYPAASHRTSTGQRQAFSLTDGSQLWLNSASAANVAFGQRERVIDLLEGEIWLQSGKDTVLPKRDLLVSTPIARLRAMGTQFSVWLDGDTVDLSVYEGAVRIEPHASVAAQLPVQVIAAGERLRFTAAGATSKQAAALERQTWRNGTLLAQNIRLDAFLQELSRHRRGRIDCASEVASLHLIGVYQLSDTDAVLDSLAQALPVRISRITPWWVRVNAR